MNNQWQTNEIYLQSSDARQQPIWKRWRASISCNSSMLCSYLYMMAWSLVTIASYTH